MANNTDKAAADKAAAEKAAEKAASEKAATAPKSDTPTLPKPPKGYKLKDWTFGSRIDAGKHGIVDLETLTEQRAAKLVSKGFRYLEKA